MSASRIARIAPASSQYLYMRAIADFHSYHIADEAKETLWTGGNKCFILHRTHAIVTKGISSEDEKHLKNAILIKIVICAQVLFDS